MTTKQDEQEMKEAVESAEKDTQQELPLAQPEKPQTHNETIPQIKSDYKVDVREVRTNYFDPVVWNQMKGMAETFKASGALGKDENASTLVMKIQAGYEMGMKPIESIKSFYFVNGVLSIFGAATVRRLREHGWIIKYTEKPNSCTATISKDKERYTDTLTYEEAEQSNWTIAYGKLKPGWYEGANRKMKLRYGVTSMLIKTYVPEVLGSAADITEVAVDTVPVINGENKPLEIVGGDEPATEEQIQTLTNIVPKDFENDLIKSKSGGVTIDKNITKQQAINLIKELMSYKK
jgi:hypothetical protein